MNRELPDIQAGFRKGRGTRDQNANTHYIMEKARECQKTSNSASLTMLKPLTVWIIKKLWKTLKEMGLLRPPYLSPEKPVCWSRSNSKNRTWNNGLVPNWEMSASRWYIITLLI